MVQRVPYASGYARWRVSMTAAITTNTTTIVLAPPRSQVLDLTTGVRFANATATTNGTQLQDTARAWTVNQWAGYWVRAIAGTGVGQATRIASNTAQILTFDTTTVMGPVTAYASGTTYCIMPDLSYGLPKGCLLPTTGAVSSTATSGTTAAINDTAAAWNTNQWIGYQARFIGGKHGPNGSDLVTAKEGSFARVTSNTATQLVIAPALATAVDNTDIYELHSPTGQRPVLTDYDITASQGAAANSTIAIQSFDLGATPSTRTLLEINLASTQMMIANTELFVPGLPNSGIQIVTANLGASPNIIVNLGGYWIDPQEPIGTLS